MKNAITPLVDRLAAGGLVERVPDRRDRRVTWLRPTSAGLALEAAAARAQKEVECRTSLDAERLASLRDELFALVRRMEGDEAEQP